MTYAFAAAGTGGHVYPAIAVADALVARGVDTERIVFFGGDRMESTEVPAAGYRFVGMALRGIRRSLSLDNLMLPGMMWGARKKMIAEMERSEVRVMTVFGGYVSGPAALAARSVGAVTYVHEQNAIPGLANRLVARMARKSFVAFPAAASLPNAVVVGNPLRSSFSGFDRSALRREARERYDLPADLTVLGVVGGSLGAKVLNDVTRRIADDADPSRVAILHLTGEAHLAAVRAEAERSAVAWRAVAFESRMDLFYAAADLVLSRAGALTMSEIAVTGAPAVVVPYAAGTAGHQKANADHLAAAGGVVVVTQDEIDRVPVEVQQLLVDEVRRRTMGKANRALAAPDAAAEIAVELMEAANG